MVAFPFRSLPKVLTAMLAFALAAFPAGAKAPPPTPARPGTSPIERALADPIQTVCDKPAPSPTGDARDYVSYARYYWPDPSKPDGLPFVRRDGFHNLDQVAKGDHARLDHMIRHVRLLAEAWHTTHRDDCARRAGDWLRAWFVNPATAMNPNLDHAQIRLGHNRDKGSPSGVLDARGLAEVADALVWLQDSPALGKDEARTVHAWFERYFDWLLSAPNALHEHRARNNHGSWFLVQAVGIARYLGRNQVAARLCREDEALLAIQLTPDGGQPLEEARQDGLSYCVFNLEAQLDLARRSGPLGVDLWRHPTPSGACLRRALDRLLPFNANPGTWPGHQRAPLQPGFLDHLIAEAAALDNAGR